MNYIPELQFQQPDNIRYIGEIVNSISEKIRKDVLIGFIQKQYEQARLDRAAVERARSTPRRIRRKEATSDANGGRLGLSVPTYLAGDSDRPRRSASSLLYRIEGVNHDSQYTLIKKSGKITLKADFVALHDVKQYDHDRGEIKRFTRESRKRLLDKMLEIDWLKVPGPKYFITLTYPQNWPLDGRICTGHLKAWHKRIERKYGRAIYAWKREFQKRGAPHYHLYLTFGRKLNIEEQELMDFVRDSWAAIVLEYHQYKPTDDDDGEAYRRSAQAGTQTEKIRKPLGAASYLALYMCKADQETVPTERREKDGSLSPIKFLNPGRWWGFSGFGELPRNIKAETISAYQFQYGFELIRKYWLDSGLPDYNCWNKIELLDFSPELEEIYKKILAEA